LIYKQSETLRQPIKHLSNPPNGRLSLVQILKEAWLWQDVS
jgi:hypothetical protein